MEARRTLSSPILVGQDDQTSSVESPPDAQTRAQLSFSSERQPLFALSRTAIRLSKAAQSVPRCHAGNKDTRTVQLLTPMNVAVC